MSAVIETILSTRLIGIIRMERYQSPVEVARSLAEGGLCVLEFTFSGEGAPQAIETARNAQIPGVRIGAGTVLTPADVERARSAGAEFIVTPGLNPVVVEACRRYDLPIVCGALTPTEILAAMQAGADLVKLFPARQGGPQYVRDLLGPYPKAKLVPTGGVSAENAAGYLEAGAVAVAIGGNLVTGQLVLERNFAEITRRAQACVEAVADFATRRPASRME